MRSRRSKTRTCSSRCASWARSGSGASMTRGCKRTGANGLTGAMSRELSPCTSTSRGCATGRQRDQSDGHANHSRRKHISEDPMSHPNRVLTQRHLLQVQAESRRFNVQDEVANEVNLEVWIREWEEHEYERRLA